MRDRAFVNTYRKVVMDHDEELEKKIAYAEDRKRFEERHPRMQGFLKKVRERISSEPVRKGSEEVFTRWQWFMNRLRLIRGVEICPPRCLYRCRDLCKDPWRPGKGLPLGFCNCKNCCPCCGVVH